MSSQVLTNEYVQETLGKAIILLQEDDHEEKVMIAGLLLKLKGAFASGNSIPVGRGLGLNEAVALAEYYIAEETG